MAPTVGARLRSDEILSPLGQGGMDEVRRVEAVAYGTTTYRPQAPDLRNFPTRFVALHFSRLRATIQRDYRIRSSFWTPG
jgi:hypothetical protein